LAPTLEIEVVYALPQWQHAARVTLPAGARVIDALRASGLLDACPEIDLAVNAVGVWGKVVALDHVLRARDRVEIYRPLQADPKAARRERAQRQPVRARSRVKRVRG
jgi:hypothetical protein